MKESIYYNDSLIDEITWNEIEKLRDLLWSQYACSRTVLSSTIPMDNKKKVIALQAVEETGNKILAIIHSKLTSCGLEFKDLQTKCYGQNYYIEVHSVLAELFALNNNNDQAIYHFNAQLLFPQALVDDSGVITDADIHWSISSNYYEKAKSNRNTMTQEEYKNCYSLCLHHQRLAMLGYRNLLEHYQREKSLGEVNDQATTLFLKYATETINSAKELSAILKEYSQIDGLTAFESDAKKPKVSTSDENKYEWYNYLALAATQNQLQTIVAYSNKLINKDFEGLYFEAHISEQAVCDALRMRLELLVDIIISHRTLRQHYADLVKEARPKNSGSKKLKGNHDHPENAKFIKHHTQQLTESYNEFILFLNIYSYRANKGKESTGNSQEILRLTSKNGAGVWKRKIMYQYSKVELCNCFVDIQKIATGQLEERMQVAEQTPLKKRPLPEIVFTPQMDSAEGQQNSDRDKTWVEGFAYSESVSHAFGSDKLDKKQTKDRKQRSSKFFDQQNVSGVRNANEGLKRQLEFSQQYANSSGQADEQAWDDLDNEKDDIIFSTVTKRPTTPAVNTQQINIFGIAGKPVLEEIPKNQPSAQEQTKEVFLLGRENPFMQNVAQSQNYDEQDLYNIFGI